MSEPNDKWLKEDKGLDEYLRRESTVSQRYRELEADDVPPELDAAVLAQARAAIAQRASRKPTWMKWGAPLALAASAVMVVAIVLEVGVQDEVRMPLPQVEQAPVSERTPEAYVVEQMIQEAPPPVPMSPASDTQTEMVMDEPIDRALKERREVAQPQAPAAGLAPQESAAKSPEVKAVDSVVREPLEQVASDAVKRDAPAEPVVTQAANSEERDAAQRAQSEDRQFKRTAAQRVVAPAPVATATQAPAAAAGPRLQPDVWLERIRELRREGKAIEADEQWREFVKAYPQYEVSETDAARPKP